MSSRTPAPIVAPTSPEAAETILPFSEDAERDARRSRVLGLDLDPSRSQLAALPEVDVPRMRLDRLERLQGELRKRDVGGIVLYAPVNIRYATDCRNMQIWSMHNEARYCLVPAEGGAVMFDFVNCGHLSDGLETIAESRPGTLWYYHTAGTKREALVDSWADELAAVVLERCGSDRIVFDRLDPDGRSALERRNLRVSFGQDVIEHARCIKTPEELKAQRRAAFVCQLALRTMRERTAPGVSENALWSTLVAVNALFGGDYVETRLVVSGTNTNPWYTEAGERRIQAGELLAIDTDMVGPLGYSADISRTWLCHPATPSEEQRTLYRLAHEQVHHNVALLKAGLSFREFSERAWKTPERYSKLDCGVLVHGIGMCNEYPQVPPIRLFERTGYDGQFEENMTVSVESYIGEPGGKQGVKLEEMVRITERGTELVAEFPFEDELVGP